MRKLKENDIEFCIVDGTEYSFVCAMNGEFTIDSLVQIEKEFKELEDLDKYPKDTLSVVYNVVYVNGAIDEGTYPGYWEFDNPRFVYIKDETEEKE
jgi:hypothetical protein